MVISNTMPAMAIDVHTRKPRLSRGSGGLSGPAIHPIAVKLVHDAYTGICRDTKTPIIGLGGVTGWDDAAEFILAGTPPSPSAPRSSPIREPQTHRQRTRRLGARAAQAEDRRTGRHGGVGMTAATLVLLLFIAALLAGFIGALTGLGGGGLLVPIMVLAFGIDLRYAVGTSLNHRHRHQLRHAAAFVREGYTNVRVGVLLEVATVIGAIAGAILAAYVSNSFITVVFVLALFWSVLNAQTTQAAAAGHAARSREPVLPS